MSRRVLIGLGLALALTSPALAQSYEFEPGHTEVRFYWNHAGVSEQSGEWSGVSGTVDFDKDSPEATAASVTIAADSIDTGVEALDTHLKGADFFEVETYPEITFVSTGFRQTGADTGQLTGDLTIKDVTKPVTLDVEVEHMGEHPLGGFNEFYQGEWLGMSASTVINRSDFDVGLYAPMNSDAIRIEITSEMKNGGFE